MIVYVVQFPSDGAAVTIARISDREHLRLARLTAAFALERMLARPVVASERGFYYYNDLEGLFEEPCAIGLLKEADEWTD